MDWEYNNLNEVNCLFYMSKRKYNDKKTKVK